MQFTSCTTCEPLFHDLYESYEWCQAIHRSYLFDSIGQGCINFCEITRINESSFLLVIIKENIKLKENVHHSEESDWIFSLSLSSHDFTVGLVQPLVTLSLTSCIQCHLVME